MFFTSSKSTAKAPAAPPPGVALVSSRDLEKVFETPAGKMYVLRRITFDIQSGDFVSIMGPSGAGKSTLLAILGMLDHHWSGEYWFLGEPVHRMSSQQRVGLNLERNSANHMAIHRKRDLIRARWNKRCAQRIERVALNLLVAVRAFLRTGEERRLAAGRTRPRRCRYRVVAQIPVHA